MSATKGAKKGTVVTEMIVGSAAVHLDSAVKQLKEFYAKGDEFVQKISDYTVKVSDLESKIEDLTGDYERKRAELEFNLNMDYKTNKGKFAGEYLEENGLMGIEKSVYNKLNGAYTSLKADFDKKVEEERNKIQTSLSTEYNNKVALAEANIKVTEASNLAKISQLEAQLASAVNSAEMWKQQLDAERTAGVQRAQAGAIGSINIPTGK